MGKHRVARVAVAVAIGAGSIAVAELPASAHVHLFTPLGCLTTDAAQSGAAVGFAAASDAATPLNGPTAIIPLNASGQLPSGGQGAENACA